MRAVNLKSSLKRALILLFTAVLATVILTGCKKENTKDQTNTQNQTENVTNSTEDSSKEETETDETGSRENAQANNEETEKIDINIAALKGPTGIGMVKLMEDAGNNETANNYKFTVAGEADEISTGLIKGEIDIAAVPCNLASVLYNKTQGKIKLAAINTLGVLYIIETGDTIKSVEDLKGKTIYSTGYGTTPQYTLNHLLSSHGIDPDKDVTIEYKTEPTEVAAILSEADEAIAMLPQPYVTTVMMNNDKVRIAIDIDAEWKALNDGNGVVTGVLVVNSDFLDSHPQAVADFLKEYEASTNYVKENVDEAAELVEKFGLFKAAVAKKAIPYCNITYISGTEMKEMAEKYLNILYDQNPQSVGGTMPADDFYYLP